MRGKPLHLPDSTIKINNTPKLEGPAKSSRPFFTTEVQLPALHGPVAHGWSWRALRGSPPDREPNSPSQLQVDAYVSLTKWPKCLCLAEAASPGCLLSYQDWICSSTCRPRELQHPSNWPVTSGVREWTGINKPCSPLISHSLFFFPPVFFFP